MELRAAKMELSRQAGHVVPLAQVIHALVERWRRDGRPTQGMAFDIADQAIGLFLEYRDVHGHDEESARSHATTEVAEGASLTDAEIGLERGEEGARNG